VRRDALSNREKILTVAAELMAQRGRNVPLAEIAEAAGVGVGTFYRGWPDRTPCYIPLITDAPILRKGFYAVGRV
jgi:hypothetical protein